MSADDDRRPRSSTEALDGVDGTGVRIGLIGEIGVSRGFHAGRGEDRCAAPRAPSARTGLPLMVHLPAGSAMAHEVLDIVEEEGGDPGTRSCAT